MYKSIYVCGSNRSSELGLPAELKCELSLPACLKTIRSKVIAGAASNGGGGQHQTFILQNGGKTFGSGISTCGALTQFDKEVKRQRSHVDPDASLGPIPLHLPFLVRKVSCGIRHTLFVEAISGCIYACGDNRYGQLGLGDSRIKTTDSPTKIPHVEKVYLLECGPDFCFAATLEKGLFSWGANSAGQCAQNCISDIFEPRNCIFHAPKLAQTEAITKQSKQHSNLLTAEHDVLRRAMRERQSRVSEGSSGALSINLVGVGGINDIKTLHTQVNTQANARTGGAESLGLSGKIRKSRGAASSVATSLIFAADENAISTSNKQHFYRTLSCGEQHCLISDYSMVHSWGTGSNLNKQLGILSTAGAEAKDVYLAFYPLDPILDRKVHVKQFVCGGQHSMALDRDGGVWVFGDNSYSQLGFPSATHPLIDRPTLLPGMAGNKVRQVATSTMHSMFLL